MPKNVLMILCVATAAAVYLYYMFGQPRSDDSDSPEYKNKLMKWRIKFVSGLVIFVILIVPLFN